MISSRSVPPIGAGWWRLFLPEGYCSGRVLRRQT
jgi:hypothetical protein